jgi:hypothetical protein
VANKILLNDGTSAILLNDAASFVLLNGAPLRSAVSGIIYGQFAVRQTLAGAEGGGILHAPGIYRAAATSFDGSDDILSRGAELTGAADSKLWTGSLWFYHDDSTTTEMMLYQSPTGVSSANCRVYVDGSVSAAVVEGENAPGSGVLGLSIQTGNNTVISDRWHHLMWSVNRADTGQRHLYIDGVSSLNVNSYTDVANEFTNGDFYVGNRGDNPSFFAWSGQLAEIYYYPGIYLDLSVLANRRLFLTDHGRPTNPHAVIAQLGPPILGLYGTVWADWATNKGTGGGMTNTGPVAGDIGIVLP